MHEVNGVMTTADLKCYAIATVVHDYLTSEPMPGCACAAIQEQLLAYLMNEPAPELTALPEQRCEACNVVREALQSTLTPDALLRLGVEVVAGNPMAITLANLLPIRPSRLLQ